MRTDQFDYDLPQRLIAQYPLSERSSSKLLVVDRKTQVFSHARFSDLRDMLRPGDLMVLNNTRVIPARLSGHVERRGVVEFLLTEKKDEARWGVLFRNPAEGLRVSLDGGVWGSLRREPDKSWTIRFSKPVERIISSAGRMPLPPYIEREPEPSDKKTYQTVYATEEGSVAAPTAGLHFDPELISAEDSRLRTGVADMPILDLSPSQSGHDGFEIRPSSRCLSHTMWHETIGCWA